MDGEVGPATARALAEGAARFDEGRFFDAHEVWEEAWRADRGAPRLLLQGLIQIAAGFHKGLVQRRPAGMVRLLGAGLAKLEAAGRLADDLAAFRREVAGWREAARAWAEGGPPPPGPPPRVAPFPRAS